MKTTRAIHTGFLPFDELKKLSGGHWHDRLISSQVDILGHKLGIFSVHNIASWRWELELKVTDRSNDPSSGGEARSEAEISHVTDNVALAYRPVLQTLARLIASDRRAVLLATEAGEALLANAPARRLGLDSGGLQQMDWRQLCSTARRAGSATVSMSIKGLDLEGELVFLPLGKATAYHLRLSEHDGEAVWLRNRARAATLLRVAHDLRTPIQSLLASAETLVENEHRDVDTLGSLRTTAELTLDHIDNVLAVIRGEQGAAASQKDEPFSVTNELTSLIKVVQPIADRRGVTLHVSFPKEVPPNVVGPVRFVRALFQNMIDNAIKYGGGSVEIELGATQLKKSLDAVESTDPQLDVFLEVRDHGGGLSDEQKDRFRQISGKKPVPYPPPSTEERAAGGMNVLGHAIVQLGGRIEVFDRDADGAALQEEDDVVAGTILCAHFTLPIERTTEPEGNDTPEETTSGALLGYKILVVEDSPSSRAWLGHVLRSAGAEVALASSGKEALEILERKERGNFNMVLSDLTLPQMNGVELARQIMQKNTSGELGQSLKIVGLTAHVEDRVRKACLATGMLQVLEKPIRAEPLCSALRSLLESEPPCSQMESNSRSENLHASIFDDSVVTELVSGLGIESARQFISRALEEAETAMLSLQRDGVNDTTSCKLHAATGACGLTGLNEVYKGLRTLEDSVKRDPNNLSDSTVKLAKALKVATAAINSPQFGRRLTK